MYGRTQAPKMAEKEQNQTEELTPTGVLKCICKADDGV